MDNYNPKFVPVWAERFKTGEITFFFSGIVYTAHLLSAQLEPNLPNFVGFPNQTFLFASDEIPKEYLPFMLTHEIREFTKYKDQTDRCLKSLLDELENIPDDINIDYIAFRYEFFKRLVIFYEHKSGSEIDDLKREISTSLAHLEQLDIKTK